MLGILTQINATWMQIKKKNNKMSETGEKKKRERKDSYIVPPFTVRLKLI